MPQCMTAFYKHVCSFGARDYAMQCYVMLLALVAAHDSLQKKYLSTSYSGQKCTLEHPHH